MDRAQFMKQLERLLSDISEAEKQEALAYYNSYFDEAGPENEASVIRELGSPGKVAAIIKADLDESNEEYAQYTENGYEDLRENKASYMPEIRQRDGKHAGKTDRIHRGYRPKEKGSNSRFILILIALVFLSPFIITAASGVFSILLVVILFPLLLQKFHRYRNQLLPLRKHLLQSAFPLFLFSCLLLLLIPIHDFLEKVCYLTKNPWENRGAQPSC